MMWDLNKWLLIINIILAIFQFLREIRNFTNWFCKQKTENKINKRFKKYKGLDTRLVCPNFQCEKVNNAVVERVGNKYVHYRCKNCGMSFIKDIDTIKQEYIEEYD